MLNLFESEHIPFLDWNDWFFFYFFLQNFSFKTIFTPKEGHEMILFFFKQNFSFKTTFTPKEGQQSPN